MNVSYMYDEIELTSWDTPIFLVSYYIECSFILSSYCIVSYRGHLNKIRINKDLLLCSILSFSIISYHGGIYSIYKRERADKIKDHSVRSEMIAINFPVCYAWNVQAMAC